MAARSARRAPMGARGSMLLAPSATANRTTGVAPLAVFFDVTRPASGTVQPGGSDRWADYHWSWSFSDHTAGTWSTTGRSKNAAQGYCAAHVFEQPGLYQVKCTVTDPNGVVTQYSDSVLVDDPEQVYANSTIYVSTGGNDTTGNGSLELPYLTAAKGFDVLFASNGPRRLLFKGPGTYTLGSTRSVSSLTGPFHIGSYGADNATLSVTHNSDGFEFATSVSDVRFVDIDIAGPGSSSTGHGVHMPAQSLLLRCDVSAFDTGVYVHDTAREGVAIVDSSVHDMDTYCVYVSPGNDADAIEHFAIMGSTLEDTTGNALLRMYASRSVWYGNAFGNAGQSATRVLGLHTPRKTEFVLVQQNSWNCVQDWLLEIGPENDDNGGGPQQLVENVIVEGNLVTCTNFRVARAVLIFASYVDVRNNVFDFSTCTAAALPCSIYARGIGPAPVGVRIENNTAYRSDSVGSPPELRMVADAVSGDSTIVRNNVVWSPTVTAQEASGTVTNTTNLVNSNPSFTNAGTRDFTLASGSAAIGYGTTIPLRTDRAGNARPFGAAIDAGAYERQTSP